MSKRRICVVGCTGKMGTVVCQSILASSEYELVAGVDISRVGDDLGPLIGVSHLGIPVTGNLQSILAEYELDAVIDFTTPMAVVSNVALCLQARVPALVGTTGISEEDLEKLQLLAAKVESAALIVPNFAIGALLMMEFVKKAAKYMHSVEIIEMHNPKKIDKPSGTALRTRQNILKVLKVSDDTDPQSVVPIHSVRLPGLVAHQQVMFGDVGQLLTIKHDSFNRESFIPGIMLGLHQLFHVKGVKVGLDI